MFLRDHFGVIARSASDEAIPMCPMQRPEPVITQISPFRILAGNKVDLLLSRSCLDLFLAGDCFLNITCFLDVNQLFNIVLCGEPRVELLPVLVYTALDIIRYTRIQDRIARIRHNVDVIGFRFHSRRLFGSLRDCFAPLAMTSSASQQVLSLALISRHSSRRRASARNPGDTPLRGRRSRRAGSR
jgi:hypothetical protein